MQFQITDQEIKQESLRREILRDVSGAYLSFEGLVRNHNDGKPVNGLEYSSYIPLAEKEGMRILSEAKERYSIEAAACVHRIGSLKIGEIAVWVGVSAAHRDAAFEANRYIIDQTKARVPIWKREAYLDSPAEWVNCTEDTPR